MQIPDRNIELLAQSRLVLVEQFGKSFLLPFVLAKHGDAVRGRQLRQFSQRFLGFGLELLSRLNRQREMRNLLAPDKAGHRA